MRGHRWTCAQIIRTWPQYIRVYHKKLSETEMQQMLRKHIKMPAQVLVVPPAPVPPAAIRSWMCASCLVSLALLAWLAWLAFDDRCSEIRLGIQLGNQSIVRMVIGRKLDC